MRNQCNMLLVNIVFLKISSSIQNIFQKLSICNIFDLISIIYRKCNRLIICRLKTLEKSLDISIILHMFVIPFHIVIAIFS